MDITKVPIFARVMAEKMGLVGSDMGFADLVAHARQQIRRLEGRAEIVCGPITTGGTGHSGYNVLLFNHAIELLELEGRPMFNQIPYEYHLARLETIWKQKHPDRYCQPILDEFYKPLFEDRRFRRAWFLPGWERSTGASWEHAQLQKLQVSISYLPDDWIYDLDVRNRTLL